MKKANDWASPPEFVPKASPYQHQEGESDTAGPREVSPIADAGSNNDTKQPTPSKALDFATVLANKFVPASIKALNQAETSATINAGKIPTLDTQTIFEDLVPVGVDCVCELAKHQYSGVSHDIIMGIRKVPLELRYGLYSTKPLSLDGADGVDGANDREAAAAADNNTEAETWGNGDPRNSKTWEVKIATLSGKAERERYDNLIKATSIKRAITQDTKDLTSSKTFRDKFEGLLTLERDTILRLYEHLSQYRVDVIPFALGDGSGSYLYAHIMIPGIADVQPALSVGDACLVRPVEPMQLPKYQNMNQMVYDPSRNAYIPNPVEIQASVLRIVRGRGGNPDEVVITWLSKEDDAAVQHAWSYYPPNRRVCNVRFIPHTSVLERCLTALDWAAQLPPDTANILILAKEEKAQLNLPKYRDGYKHSKAVDGKCLNIGQYKLNGKQHDFVTMCVSRTIHASTDRVREPMLLTGPAGTGKTSTLYAAINQVLDLDPKNRVLICTPSHTAANVLAERLGENLSEKELFRLVDTNRLSDTIPFKVLKYCKRNPISSSFTLPPLKELMKFRVIICTCLDAHLLYRAGLCNATLRLWRKCFSNSIEKLMSRPLLPFDGRIDGVHEPHFTHLFIDEAAQATEPESLIPISVVVDPVPGSVKVEIALVGDPRQLGPKVYSSLAADNGLNLSFLERLLQRPNTLAFADAEEKKDFAPINNMDDLLAFYNENKEQTSAFLNINYRCQPAILMMPSALFYFDKLQNAKMSDDADPEVTSRWCSKLRLLEKVKRRVGLDDELAGDVSADIPKIFRPLKQDHWPIHFRGVVGRDVSVALDNFSGTNSWSNVEEAEECSSIVLNLAMSGVKPEDIGVMAPFRGQVVKIRQLLRNVDLGIVNVGTIEDYQAVERDVIVLSLTRSTHKFVEFDVKQRAGVFRQPKTTNVALTRAKHLLIVVGNPNVMAECPIWRQWLWFCLRNGLWYGNPGSKGYAGLELTDSLIYSTTPVGDSIDKGIVTVGTLERISRRTGSYDPDSIDEMIAKGVYTGSSSGCDGNAGSTTPPTNQAPDVPVSLTNGLPNLVASAPDMGPTGMGNPRTAAPVAGTKTSNSQPPTAPPPGANGGQPPQSLQPRTPILGPGGMGRGDLLSGSRPPQNMPQMPPFGPDGISPGGPPGMMMPQHYFQGGMLFSGPPPGYMGGPPPDYMGGPPPDYMGGPPPGYMGGPPPPWQLHDAYAAATTNTTKWYTAAASFKKSKKKSPKGSWDGTRRTRYRPPGL